MTLGLADTKAAHPSPITRVDGYAKGVEQVVTVDTKVKGLGYIYDDFDSVDDFINVYGRLGVSGGSSSDVVATGISYSAGYHKTQLLTDNCRAKVTIQDGVVVYGESRLVICADPQFTRYYGIAIRRGLLASEVSIIRGKSSISVDKYETTVVTLAAGDEFEVWYDRINSVVRIYQNGSELASKFFEPTDIPHGVGCRYVGVVMGTNWLLDIGPNFDDFEAWDVSEPVPAVYDPVDSLTVNPNWVELVGDAEVKRNLFTPLSLGPDDDEVAIRWTDPMTTNSVKVVFTANRTLFSGRFTVVVRANSDFTNFIGMRFDTNGNIRAVTGTGPHTQTGRGSTLSWSVRDGHQYTITYDDATETIRCYKGGKRSPIVEWAAGSDFTASGKYVGMVWERVPGSGVEVSSFEAYDVDADSPLPEA